MSDFQPIILKNITDLHNIEVYMKNGGYGAFKKALKLTPEAIIEEVKRSGLRGRGGACFPTGMKWSFMPQKTDKPKYLCANGDESEPASFKDREIFEKNPHQFIEGTLIACKAMGIKTAYVYIRGEYQPWIVILQKAIDDAYAKGLIGKNIQGSDFSTEIYIHRGAGAYICGEETALLNSIEGKRGMPRFKPPFPANFGLWGCPTTINNIETLANIPPIIENGGEWFSKIGEPKHAGSLLYGLSGHINKPGIYELPSGTLLTDLIYKYGGGVKDNKAIKMIIPGGSSMPPLTADEIEGLQMDNEHLKSVNSYIGTGGIVVMNEDTDVVKVIKRITKFYYHESCGQCTPCREGCGWMLRILDRIDKGMGRNEDIELLRDVANNIEGNTICAFGDAAAWPVKWAIKKFMPDFEKKVKESVELPVANKVHSLRLTVQQ
ncbi:MAG: NADH-quinone oxidoreductase subunit NuoF [Ignavibacteria bacterium]|nr:NADH-quinone oxidoreductase subunit NuoF [Ignavibacteria bacterium]